MCSIFLSITLPLEKALVNTEMELSIPKCIIKPSIEMIQDRFASVNSVLLEVLMAVKMIFPKQVVQNIVETFYAVSTWGKQAKTKERKSRKPKIGTTVCIRTIFQVFCQLYYVHIDEIRHERHYFNILKEHKEIIRAFNSFSGGLLMLKPDIDRFLNVTFKTVFFCIYSGVC